MMLESVGIPLAGKTARITFGALAERAHDDTRCVMAVAAAGATVSEPPDHERDV
jgi:hypothetical protein